MEKLQAEPRSPSTNPGKQRGFVRKFTADDIDAISALSMEMFPRSKEMSSDQQKMMIRRLYLENPFNGDEIHSLVYDGGNGEVDGFLGVIHKPMIWKGKPIKVAHSNHLMLRDSQRSTLASVALIKTMMQGNHDFCFADSSSVTSRFLWERCGGLTSWVYSVYYRHMLKPLGFVKNRLPDKYMGFATPFTKSGDFIINRLPGSPFKFKKPPGKIEDLKTSELLALMEELHRNVNIRPVYNEKSLEWLIDTIKIEKRYGPFKAIKVTSWRGYTAGWVLYHQKKNGMCEILQFEAKNGMQDLVFQALCYHAYQGGGVELDGRLDPRYFKNFGNKSTIYVPGRMWTLIHSNNAELLLELQSGKAILSRLEGDLWLV